VKDSNVGEKINIILGDVNATLQIDSNTRFATDVRVDGNVFFKVPYGTFVSRKTQTVGSTSVAYAMDFNTTEDVFMIRRVGDTNFMVGVAGDYELIISVLATGTINKHINVWFEKNNSNVALSNTKLEFSTNNTDNLIAIPFISRSNISC